MVQCIVLKRANAPRFRWCALNFSIVLLQTIFWITRARELEAFFFGLLEFYVIPILKLLKNNFLYCQFFFTTQLSLGWILQFGKNLNIHSNKSCRIKVCFIYFQKFHNRRSYNFIINCNPPVCTLKTCEPLFQILVFHNHVIQGDRRRFFLVILNNACTEL